MKDYFKNVVTICVPMKLQHTIYILSQRLVPVKEEMCHETDITHNCRY